MDSTESCERGFEYEILKRSRRKIRVLFYWKTIGIVACVSSVAMLQTLQTSINIEGNKGAIALTSGYITSILFSVFCCPMLLRRLGPNVALVLGDACFLVYCLSNFIPELISLTVGAVISGVGRSILFPSYTILILAIASGTAELSKPSTEKHYQNFFQSRFYGMVESISIIGNSLSYSILYGFSSASQPHVVEVTTSAPTTNSTESPENQYQYCGVNDCQDPDVVNDSINQYVPPDKLSVYILVTVASFLVVISMLIHSFIYPGLGRYSHKLSKIKDRANQQIQELKDANNNVKRHVDGDLVCVNHGFNDDEKKTDEDRDETPGNRGNEDSQSVSSHKRGSEEGDASEESKSLKEILMDTALFFVKPRSLMLGVSTLHHGMMLGFIFADITRAYASCVAGVEMTGLFVVSFGITAMPSALLYGKMTFPRRRYILYAGSCTLEFLLYVWCFLWVPNPDELWVIFLLFAGFGIVNGIFRQNIVAAYTLHFKEKSVAFSIFNVYFLSGIGLQYGLSTFMCVRDKIVLQVGVLLAGAILFVIAEYVRARKQRSHPEDDEPFELATKL